MSAKAAYDKMPPRAQAGHQAAFNRIVRHLEATAPRGAKIFEVHHSIEHARKLYHAEMLKELPAETCEQTVMAAISHA